MNNLLSPKLIPTYIGIAILVTCCLCRFKLSARKARKVLQRSGNDRSGWYFSCWLGSFLPTSVVLLALAVIVTLTLRKTIPSNGLGLIIAVGVGVIGNNVDRQVSGGWTSYWSRIHDSLRAAMPARESPRYPPDDCQRTRFNVEHERLYLRDERKKALDYIFAGPVCTTTKPCAGHSAAAAGSAVAQAAETADSSDVAARTLAEIQAVRSEIAELRQLVSRISGRGA